MRPVNRGAAPRIYTSYRDAQQDLVAALGDFCCYCERQIETHLAVEHIQPKSRKRSLLNAWGNFLLGCVNCNSCKGKKAVKLSNFVWPDVDNTARAFQYSPTGEVCARPRTRRLNRQKAEAMIALVGLDRIPSNSNRRKRPTKNDIRWIRRQEAFDLAIRKLEDLATENTPIVRQLIVDTAVARGMFSIWMQVFQADPDMRRRFIAAFKGTATNCFNPPTYGAVRRPGGCM